MYNYTLSLDDISARNESRRRAQVRRRRRAFKVKQTLGDIFSAIISLAMFYSPVIIMIAVAFTCKMPEAKYFCYILAALAAIPITARVIEYLREE